MKQEVWLGDCLELMKNIPDKSVDMVLCDLPYGTTACKWDVIIPFDKLWEHYNRILKSNKAIILFGSEPFSSHLRISNIKNWKYDWIWEKSKGCNFTHAKNMPIKFHETISVFSEGKVGHAVQLGEKRMIYNPQGLIKVDKKWSRPQKYENGHKLKRDSHKLERIIEFENYPKSILKFNNSDNRERGLHPTQKPLALCEYLIKTYSSEDDLVLDNCAGSGSTLLAAKNLNRQFIGIEKEEEFYKICLERLK